MAEDPESPKADEPVEGGRDQGFAHAPADAVGGETAATGTAAPAVAPALSALVFREVSGRATTIRRVAWVALAVGAIALVGSLVASRGSGSDAKLRRQLQDALAREHPAAKEVHRSSGRGLESLLTADRVAAWSPNERRLLAIAPDPADLPGSYRLADAAVNDPTDTLSLGDRWYAPRMRTGDCTRTVDMASVPSLVASYVPGDAELLAPAAPNTLVIGAPYAVGLRLYLVDTPAQRDELAGTFVDFVGGSLPATCPGAVVNGTPVAVSVPPLGSRRTAFASEGQLSDSATSVVSVGDRILAVVSFATLGPSSGGARLPSRQEQEPVVAAVVHALEASPLAGT